MLALEMSLQITPSNADSIQVELFSEYAFNLLNLLSYDFRSQRRRETGSIQIQSACECPLPQWTLLFFTKTIKEIRWKPPNSLTLLTHLVAPYPSFPLLSVEEPQCLSPGFYHLSFLLHLQPSPSLFPFFCQGLGMFKSLTFKTTLPPLPCDPLSTAVLTPSVSHLISRKLCLSSSPPLLKSNSSFFKKKFLFIYLGCSGS